MQTSLTPFLLQVLKSLPWKKVDIKIISVEVARGKLDESLDYEPVDQRDNIVNYLRQKEYDLIYEQPHTSQLISYDLYFVHKSIPLTNKVKEKVHAYYRYSQGIPNLVMCRNYHCFNQGSRKHCYATIIHYTQRFSKVSCLSYCSYLRRKVHVPSYTQKMHSLKRILCLPL